MDGPPVAVSDVVSEAGRHLRAGDAAAARALLDAAPEPEVGALAELRARASYLELRFGDAIEAWERAYALYRSERDQLGAVRVARTLGYMHGAVMGDAAVMSGWLARATTLLGDDADSVERGWVALNIGMFEPDRAAKEARFRDALVVARRHGDVALELATLAYLGASLVHADRREEGMLLLDEALAAVTGGEIDDFLVLEEVFCQLFSACEHACDVDRADQWMRVGQLIAERRKLPAVSAFCHTHYGGVLTVAGRFSEADATLTEAVRLWGLGYRSLRAGALVRLADLRVRQGRYEEAARLLDGLEEQTDAARAVAVIRLDRGDTAGAAAVLTRALRELGAATTAAPLLSLLVDVHLAADDVDAADRAARSLADVASTYATPYLQALAAFARGRVCLASGSGDATACLRDALAGFGRAQLPVELARARLALADALASSDPDAAMAEARTALDSFARLEAARDADAASALLRALGGSPPARPRPPGVLTARENEVLQLLGHGLSNPEISDRLFISRKTVEHHVGNVLSKLGLRSRAEAAAYAARTRPGEE